VQDLSVKPVGAVKDFPYTLKVATLPPGITPEGQSRLYLTLIPNTQQAFKLAEPITVDLIDVKGIKFIKDQLLSGRSETFLQKFLDLVRIRPLPALQECSVGIDDEIRIRHPSVSLLQRVLHVIDDPGDIRVHFRHSELDVFFAHFKGVGL
ncbi:hypothetical protein ACFLT9_06065, partial [Acidobacteriota bacterium]